MRDLLFEFDTESVTVVNTAEPQSDSVHNTLTSDHEHSASEQVMSMRRTLTCSLQCKVSVVFQFDAKLIGFCSIDLLSFI